jgi:hypothetical protein
MSNPASCAFCYSAPGPFSKQALAAIGKKKMMTHGLNTMQELNPPFRSSEQKVIAAAKQLSQANPAWSSNFLHDPE